MNHVIFSKSFDSSGHCRPNQVMPLQQLQDFLIKRRFESAGIFFNKNFHHKGVGQIQGEFLLK